jgi:hypothetical protein
MAKLADFLEKLSSDPAFEAKYDADPTGTMQGFGLNPHQIDLVLHGTAEQIRKALHEEDPSAKFVVYMVKRG